jgi:hypothetical protein
MVRRVCRFKTGVDNGMQVLRDSVEGPCLHRPENWLMRLLNDEPKPVYKVGFISEKGKATAREA